MKTKNGYLFLILFLILEGLFPIFSYFALLTLPTLWLSASTVFVSFMFGIIVFVKKGLYKQYKQKELIVPTIFASLFLGLGGLLYFFGIKYTTPSTASILLLFQSFFAFIIFNIFGKEDYNYKKIIGAILMFIGGVIVMYDGDSFINIGAIIMLVACLIYTLGNYYMKQASLRGANPFFLLVNRNFLMIIIIGIMARVFAGPIDLVLIKQNFIWIFLIGFLVFFIAKYFWILALTKLNSFVAISSMPIVSIFVMIFTFIILKEIPSYREMFGFIPIGIGTLLLVK